MLAYMKATIDIPDDIYRQVKAKSALEGMAVREVAISLFSAWIGKPTGPGADVDQTGVTQGDQPPPPPAWFGALRAYGPNARGRYDMRAVRHSVAKGRAKEKSAT